MPRKVKVFYLALKDIENSAEYYKLQKKGLGKEFERQVHSAFKKIQKFPYAASFAYDSVRYKVIEQFPHIVLYEFDETTVYILRIFNTHQEPLF